MNKFKIGDKVVRALLPIPELPLGTVSTVSNVDMGLIWLVGISGGLLHSNFTLHSTDTARRAPNGTSEWKFKVAAIEGINWREVTRDLSRTQPVLLVHGGRRWDKEVSEDYTVQVKDELGTVTEEPRTRTWDEGHGEELRYVAISTAFLSMAKAKRLPCSLADVVHEDTDGAVFRIQGHFSAIQAWATDVNNKSWPARRRHEHTTITVSALNIGGG